MVQSSYKLSYKEKNLSKVWFILIEGVKEGPYSISDLRRDPRVTPDTLVWRQGFKSWAPIRDVPELKAVFEDAKNGKQEETPSAAKFSLHSKGEIALRQRQEPPYFLFWLAIALVLASFALTQYFLQG